MLRNLLLDVLLSGIGGSLFVLLLGRLMPDDKVRAIGVSLGKKLSAFGETKLGKPFYEAVESFAQHSVGVFFEGLNEGLDSDDKKEAK